MTYRGSWYSCTQFDKFDNNTNDNTDSLTPDHHSLHHSHYDGNAKNDFTLDGYILRFTQNQ